MTVLNLEKEYFKPINGYEGLYSVSNYGRVYSHTRFDGMGRELKGKFLLPQLRGKNYLSVTLCRDGETCINSIHVLVCSHFNGNGDRKNVVNHIDKNTLNNMSTNLEWVSVQRNVEHSHAMHWNVQYPSGKTEKVYNLSAFCREHNLDSGHMVKVAKGKYVSHKGYRCYYV